MMEAEQPYGDGKSTPGYISRYRRSNIIWLILWIAIGVAIFITGLLIWQTRTNILTVIAVLAVLPGAKRVVALIAAGRKRSVTTERCRRIETAVEPYKYAGEIDLHDYEPDVPWEDEEGEEVDSSLEESPSAEKEIPWNIIFTDYIFTSTEKIMMLDFMVVLERTVVILPSVDKIRHDNTDMDYIKKYLTEGIHRWGDNFRIEFARSDEELLDKLGKLHKSYVQKDMTVRTQADRRLSGELETGDDTARRQRDLRERREVLAYLKSLAI